MTESGIPESICESGYSTHQRAHGASSSAPRAVSREYGGPPVAADERLDPSEVGALRDRVREAE